MVVSVGVKHNSWSDIAPGYAGGLYSACLGVAVGFMDFASGWVPGRAVSYVVGLAAVLVVGFLARRATGNIRAGFSAAVLIAGALFMCVAIGRLGSAARVVGQPSEQEYGEAIIYAHADRILRGESLYQPLDRPPYTVVAYTPLYYGVAAGLQRIVGPGWMPGRMVSYIAGLVAAVLVGLIAKSATADIRAGFLAAALFVALGFPGRLDPWYALYKEDVLGVALSVSAITVLLGRTGRWHAVVAGLLAGLAFLTKQTFVAAALAGAIWLWARDRPTAGVFIGTWLAVVVGTISTFELSSRAFIANTVLANVVPFSLDALRPGLGLLWQYQAGALLIAVGYVVGRLRSGCAWHADLRQLYWTASFLPVAGLAKIGSNSNYWIELAASTAVLATLGVWQARHWRLLKGAVALAPVGLLLGSIVYVLPTFGASAVPLLSLTAAQGSPSADLGPVVERVRAEPGPVLADPLDVLALAQKDLLLEPYLFNILYTQGRWDPGPLVRSICNHQIGLVVLSWAVDTSYTRTPSMYQGYSLELPPPIVDALLQSMVLDSQQGDRFLYVPAPVSTGRTLAGACTTACEPRC